jgi:protein-disulfide isomerase
MSPAESKKSTKEKAAAARAAAEAEQRRKDRNIRIIGGIAILIVVGLIIGIGVIGSRQNSSTVASSLGTEVVNDAALPTGANGADGDNPWGMPINDAAGKPTLAIWEDFQCPACAAFEAQYGPTIEKLAADGVANVVYRPTTFIEKNFPAGANPLSSSRAASAYGCAVDAGQGQKFHDIVFANQPAQEGDGWSDEQLIQFGKDAGITGDKLTRFESCVKDRTYIQWANNSYLTFQSSNVPGTPALYLNGKEVPNSAYKDLAGYIAQNS